VGNLVEPFDWVVSSPPIALRRRGELDQLPAGLDRRAATSELGLVPVARVAHIARRGLILNLSETFFWTDSGRRLQEFFASKGFHLTSAISVSEGLAPASRIPTVLCVLTREVPNGLFVARLTPTTDGTRVLCMATFDVNSAGRIIRHLEVSAWDDTPSNGS
jgi:hypothetical protein